MRSQPWECLGIWPSVSHVEPESLTSGKSMLPPADLLLRGHLKDRARRPALEPPLRCTTPGLVADICPWMTQAPRSTARTPCPCLSFAQATPRALALEAKRHAFSSWLLSGHSSAPLPCVPFRITPSATALGELLHDSREVAKRAQTGLCTPVSPNSYVLRYQHQETDVDIKCTYSSGILSHV